MVPRRGNRAVWSELVPYGELCSPRVMTLLRSRSLGVSVAVTPELVSEAGTVVRACRGAGVRVGLWPMLDRHDGRWPSTTNAATFVAFVAELLEALEGAGALPDELAIDLEPPIHELRPLLRLDRRAIVRRLQAGSTGAAATRYDDLTEAIHDRGVTTLAAALPVVLTDGRGAGGWQWFLGTPVDAPPFSRVTVMAYTSLLEGYGRGTLGRADAVAVLAIAAWATRRRYGPRASVSLGATGTGALGDEPTYRSRAELAEDVAVTRAAGIDDIQLFSLGGVLGRASPEAWLDALVDTEPQARLPRLTPRAAAVVTACFGASRAIDWGRWLSRQRR